MRGFSQAYGPERTVEVGVVSAANIRSCALPEIYNRAGYVSGSAVLHPLDAG